MKKDVLHTIEENMPRFSKGQRRIAAYILSNYDKAAFMTASRLGELVGSSRRPVTVTWYSFSIRWLGWARRWAKVPSLVSSSRPSESMSSLPTGYTRPPQPDTSAATVGRPFSSDRVVTAPVVPGQVVGEVCAYLEDQEVARVDLVAAAPSAKKERVPAPSSWWDKAF